MADPTMHDLVEGVALLRGEVEKSIPDREKIVKIEAVLDLQETKNQELILEQKRLEKSEKDMEERIKDFEIVAARIGSGSPELKAYKKSEEYKSLQLYCTQGHEALNHEQKAILRTDNDIQGGYLVMPEMDAMIHKEIEEISPIRSIARVRTIGSKSLNVPVRTDIPEASYEGEAEEDDLTISNYRSETITAFRLSTTQPITQDLLSNSAFDMESELMTDAAESFAQKEGRKFVNGTGQKEPTGFTTDPRTLDDARISDISATIGFDDMMNLTGDLKTGYNPLYTYNRRTLAFLRTIKGGDGHPLWQPGMNGIVANTMNGFPYVIAEDMDDIASNSVPVAFGDFRKGYTIVDRSGVAVIRDDVTKKRFAIIEITMHLWNNGQVIVPEAIKLLKVKA